jgi:CheY-like chemotaxis protein
MPHIFVVEDDLDIRTSIAEILRDEGYDVAEYEDAQTALHALRQGSEPCLILVDLLMPGMSGEQFASTVRTSRELQRIPIIVITGASTHLSEIEVLRKPFELNDLLGVVARHCSHTGKRRSPPAHAGGAPSI